jgi:hypothetical protein
MRLVAALVALVLTTAPTNRQCVGGYDANGNPVFVLGWRVS